MLNNEQLIQLYNNYLYNVYTLINDCGLKWEFLDMSNINSNYIPSRQDEVNNGENFELTNNKYIYQYKDDKIQLALNIANEGMFFPFYCDAIDKNIVIHLGKHRLYSIKLYIETYKTFPKKLLFIYLPSDDEQNFNDIYLYNYRYCNDFSAYKLEKQNIQSAIDIIKNCDIFGSVLSALLFDTDIKPHSILNDEQLFIDFINNPFNLDKLEEEEV